jgi:(1->4)-alpha-D-glucan 1-alpha-D-glucosylmutase
LGGDSDEPRNTSFYKDFYRLQARLAFWGALNSLSQVLLKIASPGAPDFYQGTELWDLSLVDPDNRRPVDFPLRAQLLKDITKKEKKGARPLINDLLVHWKTGAIKLFVTRRALTFRRRAPDLFGQGDYIPLVAAGEREGQVVAFARRLGDRWCLAAAGRFFSNLSSPGQFPLGKAAWGETLLLLPPEAPAQWRQVFTDDLLTASPAPEGQALPLHRVFHDLPVALLKMTRRTLLWSGG